MSQAKSVNRSADMTIIARACAQLSDQTGSRKRCLGGCSTAKSRSASGSLSPLQTPGADFVAAVSPLQARN